MGNTKNCQKNQKFFFFFIKSFLKLIVPKPIQLEHLLTFLIIKRNKNWNNHLRDSALHAKSPKLIYLYYSKLFVTINVL